jgi:hypothetical protein
MSNLKRGIIFALTFVLLMGIAVPVLAVDYNPGVSVDQWAEYGNYVAPEEEDVVNMTRVGVTAVSGKEVTLSECTGYRDGTDETVDKVYDVEAGTVDGEAATFPGILIAANLNEGDALPPVDLGYTVNTSETRTYLGVSRSVNIFSYTEVGEGYTVSDTFVYDKVSGIRLEVQTDVTMDTTVLTYSHSIVDTNIFEEPEPTPTPEEGVPVEYIYVGVAVVIIVVVVVAVLLLRKK